MLHSPIWLRSFRKRCTLPLGYLPVFPFQITSVWNRGWLSALIRTSMSGRLKGKISKKRKLKLSKNLGFSLPLSVQTDWYCNHLTRLIEEFFCLNLLNNAQSKIIFGLIKLPIESIGTKKSSFKKCDEKKICTLQIRKPLQ